MTAIKPLHANTSQRFATAIATCLANLAKSGYSHDRAVELILRIIQQSHSPPPDSEVFALMASKHLTRAEAVKVLVVSRCLQELKRKQLSESEAMDHLISHMYAKVKECITQSATTTTHSILPATALARSYTSMNTFNKKSNASLSAAQLPTLDTKVRSKSASVGNKNSASVTTNSVTAIKSKPLKTLRKRQASHPQDTNPTSNPSSIENKIVVDSVAKKALMVEEQPQVKTTRSLSPTQGRKRSHTHFSPVEQCPPSSVTKRSRGI